MNEKEIIIEEIKSKQITADSFVDVAYILSSKAWIETFKNFKNPGSLSVVSLLNEHMFVVQNPSVLIEKYNNPEIMKETSVDLIRLGHKDMIIMSFELIKNYCKKTKQLNFYELPWFNSARLIRNSFSHNFKLDFSLKGKYPIPNHELQFSDKIIKFDQKMNGKDIDFDIFPIKYCSELVEMMKKSLLDDLA